MMRVLLGMVAAAVVVSAGVAHAQEEPTASEVALARDQFDQGMRFARQNEWEQAYGCFQRSYALVHRPLILLNLASAEEQTRRLVEAAEHYRQFLREAQDARDAGHRRDTQRALADLEGRIPHAHLQVEGIARGDVVQLDGAVISAAALGAALPVNPGDHEIVVRSGEREVGRATFTVAERATAEVPVHVTHETHVETPVGDGSGAEAGTGTGTGTGTGAGTRRVPDEVVVGGGGERDGAGGGGGVLSSPVFWVVVAVVVVGGAIGGYFLVQGSAEEPYRGSLGRVPFQ